MFSSVCFVLLCYFFFFKQKTAYEMRISDWSSDVCSSDLSFGGKIGVAPVKAAMAHGVCIGGATVHAVTNELDGGAPLVQIAIPYSRQDPLENVMDLEFQIGRASCRERVCQYV